MVENLQGIEKVGTEWEDGSVPARVDDFLENYPLMLESGVASIEPVPSEK